MEDIGAKLAELELIFDRSMDTDPTSPFEEMHSE